MDVPTTTVPAVQVTFLGPGNVHFAKCAIVIRVQAALERRWRGVSADHLAAVVERYKNHASPEAPLPTAEDPPAITLAGNVARLAIALQRSAGLDVAGWRDLPGQEGYAIFVCADQATGQAAAALALRALVGGRETERDAMMQRLADAAKPWVRPLAWAALAHGIPMAVVLGGERPYIALGHGYKRRLFWKNFTPATGYVATALSTRKDLTAKLLRDAGLPAPRNILVRDIETARQVADAFGYPVVIKPVAADFGKGVTTGIHDADQVHDAFVRAAQHGGVLVEEQIPGDHHRLLVIHGRCIAVSRRLSARVVGDGLSTVSELVETINLTRTETLSTAGVKISLDEVALDLLQRQGFRLSSVPAAGKVVVLRSNSNQSAGGTVEIMTEVAHPDVLRLARRAAGLLGIDVAGIDYLTADITRSPAETGGAICEVNVTPGFVNQGDSVALTCELLEPFFLPGDDGRIPTLCLLGSVDSRASLAGGLSALLGGDVARADQVQFWTSRADAGPAPLHRRVSAALADPLAAAVLIPCTPEEVVNSGLGLDVCTLAVLTAGATGHAVAAVLRVARDVVVPASLAASLPDIMAVAACRIWIVGEPPVAIRSRCAGWIRRAEGREIEVCTAGGAVWRMADPGDSEESLFLVAAGAALDLSPSRLAAALHSASSGPVSA